MPCNRHQKISTVEHRSLLADPPEIVISKISEDANKKSVWRPFRQLPSDAKAANKICKVWSLEHGSWLLGVGPDRANIFHCLEAGFIEICVKHLGGGKSGAGGPNALKCPGGRNLI
jgi:hypothetical protein